MALATNTSPGEIQLAGDLGGNEVSRNRMVITIGFDTITHNSDAVSIIFYACVAKADIVNGTFESEP